MSIFSQTRQHFCNMGLCKAGKLCPSIKLILFNRMQISTQHDNLLGIQLKFLVQGRVVRELVNANPGYLKLNQSIDFSCKKWFCLLIMSCVDWDYSDYKLNAKQYKQKTSQKSYKTEIEIFAKPGLTWLGFEQPGQELFILVHFLNWHQI